MKNVIDMSTKEMVKEYNELTGKAIVKFSRRESGERQLEKARQEATKEVAEAVKNTPKVEQPDLELVHQPVVEPEVVPEPKKINSIRSAAISNSWNDEEIAQRRKQRNTVIVKDHGEYKSVLEAFKQLGLNDKKHIQLRGIVKANGKAVYTEDDVSYKFSLGGLYIPLAEQKRAAKALRGTKKRTAEEAQDVPDEEATAQTEEA